jgi:predicted RNA-binding protein
MCQTVAYVIDDGKEVALLEDVVTVAPEQGNVRITNLFGDEKVVPGRISKIDLLKHRILISPVQSR